MFGDWMMIVNVIGCFFIWGVFVLVMFYIVNDKGYGLVWGNFFLEDNVEYGYGMYLVN